MVNAIGQPQYSSIDIELVLDETHPLYKAEEQFRSVAAILGETLGLIDTGAQAVGAGSPF